MLAKCGYRVEVAEDGRSGLDALSKGAFAAVLMDCQMPGLDGFETTREIREREHGGRRMPIIAMTANSMQGERERCLAAGMDDYLTKPLRERVLSEALALWVPDLGSRGPDALSRGRTGAGREDAPPVLDETVIRELGFDAGELASLLTVYCDQAAAQVLELSGAVGRGDALAARETAHSLKGSSATLGALRVSGLAAEVEAAAAAGELSGSRALLEALDAGLEQTLRAFDAARAGA
jgi:CheY-like chemotaxis protein